MRGDGREGKRSSATFRSTSPPPRATIDPMSRKRLIVFLSLATVAIVGLAAVWPRTAITRENAARIKVGMTRQEVETILGGPPREEGGHYPVFMVSGPPREEWATPAIVIFVFFDGDGTVDSVQVDHDDGLLAFIRRLLHF